MKILLTISLSGLLLVTGCRKVTYNTIPNPAYFRVFNSLNYGLTPDNKDQPPPYLAMIVDPTFDATGLISGGKVVGDFLDKRLAYAPPYPANAGNTSVDNYEYPGSEKVLVGPILNGFDLSSWAQIPAGKHRFLFYSRPVSSTPFLQLAPNLRQTVFADSTVTLTEGEIYTMDVLQQDVTTSPAKIGLYVRQEQFIKGAFDDSRCYVNFYNLGAKGFNARYWAQLGQNQFGSPGANLSIRDTMNVFLTLNYPDSASSPGLTVVPGYNKVLVSSLIRSQEEGVAPYIDFPVFPAYAGSDSTNIRSRVWEQVQFLSPGYDPGSNPYTNSYGVNFGNQVLLDCSNYYYTAQTGGGPGGASFLVPNLIITTPSGTYGNRSFSTISSVEVINSGVYVISVQRKYPPPAEVY